MTDVLPEEAVGLSNEQRTVLARRRLTVLSRSDLDALPQPVPLVEGVLPQVGLAMLAGSRGLGKSLLALDLAASVTCGMDDWLGRSITTGADIALVVSLEGFGGIPNRVRAWEKRSGLRASGVHWVRDGVNLANPRDADFLGLVAADLGASLVIVDSARAAGAGDESTRDMSLFVNGLELAQRNFGGLLLVLHNTGWDESRERGSTLLPDACDVNLLLEQGPSGVRKLSHRKFRDGQHMEPLPLQFVAVDGSESGVLMIPTELPVSASLRDLVLSVVRREPGLSSGKVAKLSGGNRSNVSTILGELAESRLVVNTGTTNKPAWRVLCVAPSKEEGATTPPPGDVAVGGNTGQHPNNNTGVTIHEHPDGTAQCSACGEKWLAESSDVCPKCASEEATS